VFGRNADTLIDALQQYFPDIEFVKNVNKPRRNSFEITLELDDKSILLWSGIKLTPRREKFPSSEVIIAELNKHLPQQ